MRESVVRVLARWFDGLNAGEIDDLLALFAPSPFIRNAANPPMSGPMAARTLLMDFFERTRSRTFNLLDAAENDRQVFAAWTAELTFRKGARVGELALPFDVTVPLRGIDRFKLDDADRIVELDIVHETTSVPRVIGEALQRSA